MKFGVDISHWQSNVDLVKASPHIQWIAFKATQRHNFRDPDFVARWRKAHELGMPRIAYHYAEVSTTPGEQATWFVKNVREAGTQGVWASMLDFEDPVGSSKTPSFLWSWANAWVNTVRDLTGRPVAFYTFVSYVMGVMKNPATMPGGPTTVDWIARYANVSSPWEGKEQARMYPSYPSIWQCSNGITGCVTDVPGIGKVDYNRMNDAGYARIFRSNKKYNVEEVVQSIQAAPNDATAIEVERMFVEDTPDAQSGVDDE